MAVARKHQKSELSAPPTDGHTNDKAVSTPNPLTSYSQTVCVYMVTLLALQWKGPRDSTVETYRSPFLCLFVVLYGQIPLEWLSGPLDKESLATLSFFIGKS